MVKIVKAYLNRFDDHMKEIVSGAGITFIIKVGGAFFTFIFNVILARILGAENAGIYFLCLTLITISSTIGRCGLDNTILRFVAAHSSQSEWAETKGVLFNGLLLSFSLSILFFTILFFLAPWVSDNIFNKPDMTIPLKIMSWAIVPLSLCWLIGEALRGLKQIKDSQLIQGFIAPFIACLGFALIGETYRINGAATVFTVSAAITFSLSLWLWFRATPHFKEIKPFFPFGKLLDSCVPLLWIQIMYLVMNWASICILGIWSDNAEIGIFGAAHRTAMLVSFILVSVNSIVAPKFSELHNAGDVKNLTLIAQKSTKMMIILATPILFFFIVTPQIVMNIFGTEFQAGSNILCILSIGQFVNVATGSVGYLLIMSGNEVYVKKITLLACVILICLNLLLVPALGALGAAIATSISVITLNIGSLYFVWAKMGIWTLPFYKRKQNSDP